MAIFAILDGHKFTPEVIELPAWFALEGYVNLSMFPIEEGRTPVSFDYDVEYWIYE